MKSTLFVVGSCVAALVLLVVVSSRSVKELLGYAQATADTTVSEMESQVPTAIRDQKLQNDIEHARGELIDRRVKLSLASTEVRRMKQEVAQLEAAARRRETILSEAYPALELASGDRLTEVSFAGQKWLPTELGAEIDKLLMEQDRDEQQLVIRREALDRLVKSVEDGAAAIAQMESKLLESENEFQALVIRREQAQNENELLDLVAAAGSTGKTSAAQIGTHLEGLRGDVEQLEARNEARRVTAPVGERDRGRLNQAYGRLERLKALHDKRQSSTADKAGAANDKQAADKTRSSEDARVANAQNARDSQDAQTETD